MHGVPLVGNLRAMLTDPCRFLTAQYLRVGPVFRISLLGRRLLVLAGAEANALFRRQGHVLFTSKDALGGIHQMLDADNPTMIELDGAAHSAVRSGLKDGYSGAGLYARMGKLIDSQLRLIAAWPRDEPFPVFPKIKRLVSSTLGYMATNRSPDDVMDELIYFVRALIEHVRKVRPEVMQHLPRYVKSRKAVLGMARDIWDERAARDEADDSEAADRDFVDLVRHLHASHPELVSDKDAVAAINGPFIAGLDTAASAISFLLFHILKDPSLKRRIVEEADAAFASGLPDRDSLRRMVTTRHAAMEALRLFPPAIALSRTTVTEFEFHGHRIPAGVPCLIANTVTHFLPGFFSQPELFDVERYSPPRKEHTQPNAYSPYGLGPHTCLGASTADMLYLIVTAVLFHHFDIEMQPPDQTLHTVMKPLPSPDDRFRMAITAERNPVPSR